MFLDQSQFNERVQNLAGLVISRAYNSFGSSLCLELGKLTTDLHNNQKGEAYIRIDWDWRLEDDQSVLCGSSNSRPKIAKTAKELVGLILERVDVYCAPPEIEIHLSNSHRLRSMVMATGDPQWNIKLRNGRWLSCEKGKVKIGDGSEARDLNPAERDYIEWTKLTAERWGCPEAEPVRGRCYECRYHERIDAAFSLLDFGVCRKSCIDSAFSLLDFGVCSFEGGPFDGRVTNVKSGCPRFVKS
jgi:hypothetical protein